MQVPFFNLTRQHAELGDVLTNAIEVVLEGGQFIGGTPVTKFESDFAQFSGHNHCVGCANATDAIEITLRALGIGQGDEVIVPALTWVADADAVHATGASVVFADVLMDEYTLDPDEVKAKITAKTKAIIAVHLYGRACRMAELKAIIADKPIFLIEDCAQAHGAAYQGKMVGHGGVAAIYSFFPTKNLGALGDAGAMITNDEKLAQKFRLLANHGQEKRAHHILKGRNSRLDTLQAAVLSAKLPYLNQWNVKRRQIAQQYLKLLKGVKLPPADLDCDVFHQFVINSPVRNDLQQFLSDRGVATEIHYATALPYTPAYQDLKQKAPVAKILSEQILSLPIFPQLTIAEVDFIIKTTNNFFI